MSDQGSVVVVGGTRAIGLEIVRHYTRQGSPVVLTGRHPDHVAQAVRELGGSTTGVSFDREDPYRR
ncbi:MAG: SDR family NAD(P)-dependent oxidoreductase, partial [Candidatus Limnocylindrales bacterium]